MSALLSTLAVCPVAHAEDAWTELQKRGTAQEGRKTGSEVEAERAQDRELAARRMITRVGAFASPVYLISTDDKLPGGPGLHAGVLLSSGLSLRTELQVRLGLSLYSLSLGTSHLGQFGYQFNFTPSDPTVAWLSPGASLESTIRVRPLSATSSWLLGVGAFAQANLGLKLAVPGIQRPCCAADAVAVPTTLDVNVGTLYMFGGLVESLWKLGDSDEWEVSVRCGFAYGTIKRDAAMIQPGIAVGRLF